MKDVPSIVGILHVLVTHGMNVHMVEKIWKLFMGRLKIANIEIMPLYHLVHSGQNR